MNTYTETSIPAVDLNVLLADAAAWVSAMEVDAEIVERQLILGCERGCLPDSAAHGSHSPALTVLGMDHTRILTQIRAEVKDYLAHAMIEELNRHHLDSMTYLELRCRKEEVSRRVNKLIKQIETGRERKAA